MITLFFVIWGLLIVAYLSARPFFRPIERFPVATTNPVAPSYVTTIFGYPIKYRSPELREYNLPPSARGSGGPPPVAL